MPKNNQPFAEPAAPDAERPILSAEVRERGLDALRNLIRPGAQVPTVTPENRPAGAAPPQAEPPLPGRQLPPRPEPEPWAPPGRTAAAAETRAAMAAAAPRIQATGILPNARLENYLEDPDDIQRDLAAALAGQHPRQRPVNVVAPNHPDVRAVVPGAPERPVEVNAVAVINQAVARPLPITPDWHDVRNLPGYQQGGVLRRIIRKAFEQATDAQLEQTHMICDLLNPPAHVHAVARWVAQNATPVDGIDFDFARTFPGFTAQFRVFQDEKSTFIVTQDVGGHYVYICPGGRQEGPLIANRPEPNAAQAPARRVTFGDPGAA